MYWHVKLIFALAGLMILAGTAFAFRDYITAVPRWALNLGEGDEVKPPPDAVHPSDAGAAAPVAEADPRLAEARAKVALAEEHLRRNDPVQARKLLDNLLGDPKLERFSPAWELAVARLNEVNTTILLTACPAPEKVTYEVKSGDSLWEIARGHNMTVAHLRQLNELGEETHIIPGQPLQLYPAEWRVEVDKSERRLLLFDADRLLKSYKVGIGRQDRTPVGTFVVYNRETEPVWNPPGRIIPYGHPDNVLGTRWLGLKATGETDPKLKGYGVHGTWAPESIGKAESNGCIRMENRQVEQLFLFVSEGCPVTITE